MESNNSESNKIAESSISKDNQSLTNDESNKSPEVSTNAHDSGNHNENQEKRLNVPEEKSNYIPITKYIKDNAEKSSSLLDGFDQKIEIVYRLAVLFYIIHKDNSINVNITPDYIFLDDNQLPYINLDKLKRDSQKLNADSFLLLKSEYDIYFPPDIKNSDLPISNDIEFQRRVDVYIFGCLFYSLICNANVDESNQMKETFWKLRNKHLMPEDLSTLLGHCLSNQSMYRPFFEDIIQIMNNKRFLKSLNDCYDFDIDHFTQLKVDDRVTELIKTDYDISKIPGVKIYSFKEINKSKETFANGGTCSIYKASPKSDPSVTVAFKVPLQQLDEEESKRLYREVEILSTSNHYAVQNLFGIIPEFSKRKLPVIMTLFQENGTLSDVIKKIKENPNFLNFTQKFIIMYGITAGLNYLHQKDIVHRDLKPLNIFLNELFEPIVADFGLSKKLLSSSELEQTINDFGTAIYMAPEQIRSSDSFFNLFNAKKSDIYSFAVTIYVLFSCKEPRRDFIEADLPDEFPKTIRLLIEACWANSPDMRPPIDVVLRMMSHPIFIENFGENYKLDIDRFREYQRKVVDESFIYSENLDTNDQSLDTKTIIFNDTQFDQIPADKFFKEEDFEKVSFENQKLYKFNNPFFDIQIVKKDESLFILFELKEEHFKDQHILNSLKSMIQIMLRIENGSVNPLYGIIDHPSSVTFNEYAKDIYDIFPQGDLKPPSLIIPFLPKGNLLTNLNTELNITQKFIILYGIAAGMYYLHKQSISHLNLKPSNIWLNDNYEPIINIDIVSKPRNEKENLVYFLPVFKFPYVAPELLNFKKRHSQIVNEKRVDVYSFAMVVYYLFSGIHPFDLHNGFYHILLKAMRGERPITDLIIPPPFDELIKECWSVDPQKRPSFKKILNRIGSEEFIKQIQYLDIKLFLNYQKKVVSDEFIFPIQICPIRKRDEFQIKKIIGNGTLGTVKKCIDKTSKNKVIIKDIPKKYTQIIEEQVNEFSMINFPSVVSIYGFIKSTNEKEESSILLPYASNKNLNKLIQKINKKNLLNNWNYTQKCIIVYGIAIGMYKLHSHNIVHQNLKPTNILLNKQNEPWISDFQLLNFVDPNQSFLQTSSVGPAYYMSPEAFFNRKESNEINYDEKLADVYSFGMIVYYLMTSIEPYKITDNNITDLMERIQKGERPVIPDCIPKRMKKLIISCWNPDPLLRPSFSEIAEIVSDPNFFKIEKKNFDFNKFYNYQVKLGEPQFIKLSINDIDIFSSSSHIINPEILLIDMADKCENPEIMYRLGCHYRDKTRAEKDLTKAFNYFQKAARKEHINAIIQCALCYKKGIGVMSDPNKAFELINKAIEKDSTEALVILARWYLFGFPRKYKEAYELLIKADERDHPDASALIGLLIEKNRISSDIKAVKYYKRSCFLGSYEGMYHMATRYHYGKGVKMNVNEAIRLYLLVTKNQNFDRNKSLAVFSLAKLYENNDEFNIAFNLANSYRLKDKFVGHLLCHDYFNRGIGCQKNEELSNECFQKACDKKFVNEQLKFANMFHLGKGIQQNIDEFLKWSKIAAKNGSSIAQANLCRYFKNKDEIELAEDYGIKSANSGNHLGYWNLSRLYKFIQNDEKEITYLEKLVKIGCNHALVNIGLNLKRNNKNYEAFLKFKEAADKNSTAGICHYGIELFNGKSGPKDVNEGLKLLINAAEANSKTAIKKLIRIYKCGLKGVEKNLEKAKEYEKKLELLMNRKSLKKEEIEENDDC